MIGSMLRKAQLTGGCDATAAPDDPATVTLVRFDNTSATLDWSADTTASPNEASSYEIFRNSPLPQTTLASGITGNTGDVSGLTASTSTTLLVRAVNCSGTSSGTSVTFTTAPAAPSNLTATATSSTQINLAWQDNSSDETGFIIQQRSPSGSGSWSTIHTTGAGATSYSVTGLTASTNYGFRVAATRTSPSGTSGYTAEASATTQSGLSPSWSLDFSSGTPSGYTLTRASSGTYVDSSGYIASASTDVARLTHDKNGNRLGLLVEEQRVNIAQYSEDFSNAYWTKTSQLTIDNNGGSFWTSPANTSDAVLLEQVSGTGTKTITRQFGAVTNICFSIFAQKQTTSGVGRYIYIVLRGASSDYASAVFDLDQGTVSQSSNVGATWSSVADGIEDYGNGWYRCHIRGTRSSTATNVYVGLANSGTPTMSNVGQSYTSANSTDGVYAWGAMYEAVNGPPTSYIETPTNASVTRSADLAHVLDSSITSWGDPGALVIHFYPPGQAGTLLSTDDASTAQVGIEASSTTAARAFWSSGSTSTGTIGSSGVQKAVHYWNGSTSKFCINGGTVQSGTNNLTIANTDFVTLGAEATDSSNVPGTFSQYANCVIRKVEFYSGTLTDANLQTITT
jgi:hypothetical protein